MAKKSNYYENEGLSVKEWCNKLVDNGHRLSFVWEGGGDSGWVHFEIDDAEVENEYTRALVDYCYDVLDYGSWAGEFSANGVASYVKEEGAFLGTDEYSEDQTMFWDCNIEVKVPKSLWFDDINFGMQESGSHITFQVRNGFLTSEHRDVQKSLETDIQEAIETEIAAFEKEHNFINLNYDFQVKRSEFKEEGDYLIYTITDLEMYASEGDDKDVYIEVGEQVEKVFNEKSYSNE